MAGESRLGPNTIGPYTIVRVLGRGAMGEVHEARDARSGRSVALKVVRLADGDSLDRFRREARAAAAVAHPNVAALVDSDLDGATPYIVFELVPGETLAARLKRVGRLEAREAVPLAREIAAGLEAIHRAGVVHRDLKPANVIFDAAGHAKIADFGLARTGGPGSSLTKTGDVLGTLEYLAPEQANGDRAIDGRADLYSLGVVLFLALTGELPFKGEGYGLMKKHLLEAPPAPRSLVPSIPEALERLVLELLAKSPDARPASATAVRAALASLEKAPDERPRRWLLLPAVVVVLAGIGLAARTPRAATPVTPAIPEAPPPAPTVTPPDEPLPTTFPATAEECLAKAREARLAGHLRPAIAFAREALAKDPDLLEACWVLHRARAIVEPPDRPTAKDKEAGEPEWAAYRAMTGTDPAGALPHLNRYLTYAWDEPEAWSARGDALFRLGRGDLGREDQARAIELDRKHFLPHLRLGILEKAAGHPDEAIRELSVAIERLGPAPADRKALFDALRRRGKLYATKLEQEVAAGRKEAAESLRRKARSDLRAAIDLHTGDDTADEAIQLDLLGKD